ncbi:MAG: TetR/AcrR family transcriptional regulator [Pseudomonadales bacterium]|nr:TetR/AcrR family transcriptional regulator [Pseudomonadales bacterium]
MKTRERILHTSLLLFNQRGERHVSTNHIAAELGISPGNLYYHFKNKNEIIFDLYLQYESQVSQFLALPEGRALEVGDKIEYLQAVFEGMWAFRFLHRDMQYLLSTNAELQRRYQEFYTQCLSNIEAIYSGLNNAGIIHATEEEIVSLALNTWVLITGWFSFVHSHLLSPGDEGMSKTMLQAGIHQVCALEQPYLTEAYRDQVLDMQKQFKALDQSASKAE